MILSEIKSKLFDWKFIVGILISIFFIYILGNEFNYSSFVSILIEINFSYFFTAILILLLSVYIRALRWSLYFDEKYGIKVSTLFKFQLIGYFGNNILPLRLGEIMRAFFLGNKFNISKTNVFGTIILERVLDAAGVLILIIVSFYLSSYNYNEFFIFIISLIILLLLIISFSFKKNKINYFSNSSLFNSLKNLLSGFSNLNIKNLNYSFIYTILIWSCYVAIVYLVQLSINFDLNLLDSIFILIVSTFSLAIPSAPAGIGTFEMGVKYALEILGVFDNVVEFAIILHSITFFPYTFFGGYYLIRLYFCEKK